MKLNKKEILEYQQNRSPYLMIDFVDEVIPGKSAKGYKDLKEDEWFFKVHWPKDPNVPGMLQIEALVQMSALSILSLPGNKGKIRSKSLNGDYLKLSSNQATTKENLTVRTRKKKMYSKPQVVKSSSLKNNELERLS